MSRSWLARKSPSPRITSPTRSVWAGLLVSAAAFSLSTTARADFRIGGFGTVGYSVMVGSSTPNGGQISELSGVTAKGTMRNLTRFGLNISKPLSENASIFFQLVANGSDLFHGTDEGNQFRVRSNLAGVRLDYGGYAFMFGLIPTPNFIISDYIHVGYSYNYAQPPKSYYRYADIETIVGMRASRHIEMGDLMTNIIFAAGEVAYDKTFEDASDYGSRSSFYYSLYFENELNDHLLRFGYILFPDLKFSRDFRSIQTAGTPPNQQPIEVVAPGGCNNSDMTAWGIAYRGTYFDDLELLAEASGRDLQMRGCYGPLAISEKLYQLDKAAYIALSYSIGRFKPRLGLTMHHRAADADEATAYQTRNLPDGPVRTATRAGIEKVLKDRLEEKGTTYSAGLNYQIDQQTLLKTEVEHFMATDENINGFYMPPDSTATIVNITVDYVF